MLGIISGFSGGKTDAVVGRVIDLTLSFPQTLMLLALSGVVIGLLTEQLARARPATSPTALYVILVLGLFGWPGIARIIRGQVLSIREREFVDAAQPARRLAPPDLLQGDPAQPVGAAAGLLHADDAGLHLGRGGPELPRRRHQAADADARQHPQDSINYSSADFAFFFSPAFLIAIIVVSFNLLGDGLRDALDPKADR